MTQAILPLNVRALRVNANDAQLLTGRFKGRVAQFEAMPYTAASQVPSTGDAIVQPLDSDATPIVSLKPGMHLHWELPDVYKRGQQPPEGGDPVFPAAPNTWLVIRYLQRFDTAAQTYGPVVTASFLVESDHIASTLPRDPWQVVRPAISVPLPLQPAAGQQPFRYMGRVLDYPQWNGRDPDAQYLTDFAPRYLTSIGFVGPSFASYYPECNSVFGFWDHFQDLPDISQAIAGNGAVQFRVSYHVVGWVRDAASDVFAGFGAELAKAYDDYVAEAAKQKAEVILTPADEFDRLARQKFHLAFQPADLVYTLNLDKTIATLDAPEQGLCSGIAQQQVWNMLAAPGSTAFLNNPEGAQPNAIWSDDQIGLAVGNTAVEGLSALIKSDLAAPDATPQQLADIEMLLDALQLGLLRDLEASGNSLIMLDEALHSRGFAKTFGGYVWSIEPIRSMRKGGGDQVTLPLPLAEHLYQLNTAQKAYDQGRAELDVIRRQLYMDWLRYVAAYVNPQAGDLQVSINTLAAFLSSNGTDCELGYVQARGAAIGMIDYVVDKESGAITGIAPPPGGSDQAASSLADAVRQAWRAVVAALPDPTVWSVQATPETPFWAPTDPVLVIEGDRIEPIRRNGDDACTPSRLAHEVLDRLEITTGSAALTLPSASIAGLPVISAATPMRDQVQALVAEAGLLIPMLAGPVTSAVAALPGDGNPAKADATGFAVALTTALGGSSPLDPPPPPGQPESLYARLHAPGAGPLANPVQQVSAPLSLGLTFTNAAGAGWTPYGTAWTAQSKVGDLAANRVDPFLPVFLLWEATLDPLLRDDDGRYRPDTLTRYFAMDGEGIDYVYSPGQGFTTGSAMGYSGSVVLSRQTTRSLTAQIDQYEKLFPTDPANPALDRARAVYAQAQIMSQGIDGFNQEMILQTGIARLPVEDLVKGGRDAITAAIATAAAGVANDNWYQFAFNSVSPISQGLLPNGNFGPLRAGFSTIRSLEIVDAFGQRMTLSTTNADPDGSQNAVAAFPLAPAPGDTAHAQSLYLPPRLIAPSRIWFKWLSADFDPSVAGIDADFVESNSHPATSPVCGVVLPNHLDDTLVFYQADGAGVGSFGVEHGSLVYRTRAGNAANPDDSLAVDIGAWGATPLVNPHLYGVMWHVQQQGPDFLADLMSTIRRSQGFLNPASYAQNVNLSVLIGQPLVITRAVLGVETLGGMLPVSQADTSLRPDFTHDVQNGRYRYPDRQAAGAAGIEALAIPMRMGNLADIDDGMIGYFIDGQGQQGGYGTFYAPAAPPGGTHGVQAPEATTIAPNVNAPAITLTFLMDPRAPIHATSGILPVQELAIPPDQYAAALDALQVSFVTHPVLKGAQGLVLPLPLESGYDWAWIQMGAVAALPLVANVGTEAASFGYTPQTLLEGWTQLHKAPTPPVPTPAAR